MRALLRASTLFNLNDPALAKRIKSGVHSYVAPALTLTDAVNAMFSTTSLLCALILTSAVSGHDTWEKRDSSGFRGTCDQIAKAISDASQVSFPRKWRTNARCASI